MKNYLLALLGLIAFTFTGCSKIDNADPVNNNSGDVSIANAIAIKTGAINFTNKNSSGNVTIYQQKSGTYILAFEQIQFVSTVDVDVKFAKADDTNNSAIKLFSVKNITDHLYYALPQNIDVSAFNYLFFQSDVSDTPVATALLK